LYSIILWIVSINPVKLCGLQMPSRQLIPAITFNDFLMTIPVGVFLSAAHSSSVFAFSGDPIFGQIVKSGEPVLSALVGFLFYKKAPTFTKLLCLPVIVGGVAFASLKKDDTGMYQLKFDQTALIFGMLANIFAAFKGNENSKLMKGPGGGPTDTYKRYGGVGNQFAVTTIIAFIVSVPLMFYTEGDKWPTLKQHLVSNKELQFNLVASGLGFYIYNELATMTISKTSAVTSSVANTAKRVIVMIYMAAVTGKVLTEEQKIGAGVAIFGVFGYSVIDEVFKSPPSIKQKDLKRE